ncbi:MAG: hypothetical protein ACREKL_11465 [Chthoniobacterales bacterium]
MRKLAAVFVLCGAVGLSAAEKKTAPDKAELVRWLVVHADDLRDIPFADVVMAATGKRVIPVDPKRNKAMLRQLGAALDATLAALNNPKHPIHDAGRVNEASHFIEDEIRKQVNLLPGWKCTIPLTAQNREQRSGYPDLRIEAPGGAVLYLDPKLHEAGSRGSSLRTFYYEPRALTGKIQDDAMHMLVGVEHSGGDAQSLRLTQWELIDVSKLRVNLKAEFQAGNDRIYRSEMIVGRSAK